MQQSETIFDEEMFADADTLSGVDADGGKQLSGLVRRLNEKQEQIDETEKYLKGLKAEKQRIAFEQIPMLMDEMGIELWGRSLRYTHKWNLQFVRFVGCALASGVKNIVHHFGWQTSLFFFCYLISHYFFLFTSAVLAT